nr:MAG TPA: hypothetical protein [Caudoviricetes sp.]
MSSGYPPRQRAFFVPIGFVALSLHEISGTRRQVSLAGLYAEIQHLRGILRAVLTR